MKRIVVAMWLTIVVLAISCNGGTNTDSQTAPTLTVAPPPSSTHESTDILDMSDVPTPGFTPTPTGGPPTPTEGPPTPAPPSSVPGTAPADSTPPGTTSPDTQQQGPNTGDAASGESATAVFPDVEIATGVLGYWSDNTASVEVTATLANWDELGIEGTLLAVGRCIQNGQSVGNCRGPISFSRTSSDGPVENTFTLRVPVGGLSLELDYGGGAPLEFEFDVPPRIVNVHREVWDCFSDKSNVGTVFEEERGVGCAAWKTGTVVKWDQSTPVKVYVEGPEGFAAQFKSVLAYLSPVTNLHFGEVDAARDADVVAYVGVRYSSTRSQGAICFDDEDYGCAERVWLYEKPIDRIVVFNRWTELGNDFGDFDEPHRARFRSSMIYAVVNILSDMGHRANEFSLMNEAADHRTELNPMDEALLRLHGHELVEPGMSFEDIRQLIVFNDEMLDPQTDFPELLAWSLTETSLEKLRYKTTIRYQVRAHSPGCPGRYGWSEYTAGNLTGRHPYLAWLSLDDGTDHVYALQPDAGVHQFWRRSDSGWSEISPGQFSETVSVWQSNLSDPHFLLSAILHNADWSSTSISANANGHITIRVELDSIRAPQTVEGGRVEATLIIDPILQSVIEYRANWQLDDRGCGTYVIEAIDGELGVDFVFPDEIRMGSNLLASCEAQSLGALSGYVGIEGAWARQCGPGTADEGYAHEVRFTLDDWAFVRLDLFSHDDIRLDLYRMNGSEREPVIPEAFQYLVGGYGLLREEGRLRWAHLPLEAGDYALEAVSLNRESLGEFTLTLFAQFTPPPPYRFKEIATGINISCGILLDGTPICWGGSQRRDQGWQPPEGKFKSISANGQVCAIREEGAAECWDGFIDAADPPPGEMFKQISVGWVHTCALRLDGTPVCWGRDQGGKASPPEGESLSQINAGTHHTCGVRPDGTAVCWGGGNEDPWEVQGAPFISMSLGSDYYCALRQDGEALCWGGHGLTICETQPGGWGSCRESYGSDGVSQSPPEGERFTSFSTNEPNCALRADGSPVCWSERLSGPFPEPQDERLTTVSATDRHACGLRPDGTAVCWGYNRFGEASPPSGVNAVARDQRSLPTSLMEISGGQIHTCALDSDGRAVCWGPNWWRSRFTGHFVSITSGASHACALRADGTVECRGGNSDGQSSPPGGAFTAISAGHLHTCGLRPDGTAECWGYDGNERSTPPHGEVFQSISSGLGHNCGLRIDGTAACWGGDWDEPNLGEAATPPGGVFIAISSGSWHTCGIRPSGEVECWGLDREGQSSPPQGTFAAITSGGYHTCGLRFDGTPECWGAGSPNSKVDYHYSQGLPPEGEKFVSISSGGNHACGIRTDGTPVCWGSDDFGQASPKN